MEISFELIWAISVTAKGIAKLFFKRQLFPASKNVDWKTHGSSPMIYAGKVDQSYCLSVIPRLLAMD